MDSRIQRLVEIGYALKPNHQAFRQFHVAGIFRRNRLVAIGTNVKKTHPFAFKHGYPWAAEAIHAETLAIIRGKLESYEGHTLIVFRIDNNGNLAYSRPCQHCSKLINGLGFDSVLYSDRDGDFVSFLGI